MNGLAQITIAGREVGLKFGMPAIRRIVEKMQEVKMLDGDLANDLGVVHVLYAGYLNHCAMRDTVPDLAFEAFYDYVETAPDSLETFVELKTAVTEFEESRFVKVIVDKDKKKVTTDHSTGTKSNPSVSESSDIAHSNIPY